MIEWRLENISRGRYNVGTIHGRIIRHSVMAFDWALDGLVILQEIRRDTYIFPGGQ